MDPPHFQLQSPSRGMLPKDNIFCVRIIPGPKKPWDADSFIYLLVHELLKLKISVSAYDALLRSLFALHAYVITGFGDIPTVSMHHQKKKQGYIDYIMLHRNHRCIAQ